MPLGRTQTQIIEKLQEMGKLTLEQRGVLLARPDEPTGDQLDQILQADHRITLFQLLLEVLFRFAIQVCDLLFKHLLCRG